ncbi:MAG: tetratricopeptide repeat protein [Bryobacterales bacterium]|nr:tetratricopeptide repeat protein [Bryobacterales bacterium]
MASGPYSRSSIRRILGINENRLRSWERAGLAAVKDSYTFSDLISFKTLQGLSRQRIPAKRIRKALGQLRHRLATGAQPLSELKIVSDGRRIALELPGETMEALTGQLLLKFDVERLRQASVVEMRGGAGQVRETAPDAEDLFQRALESENGDTPSAESAELYRKVLECDPRAVGAFVNLGTLRFRQGRADEAERYYRNALRINPDYALAHYNLANICDASGRLEEAVKHYSDALRCRPHYADAHYNLALVEERRERLAEAARHWGAYLRFDSSSAWAKVASFKLRTLCTLDNRLPRPAGIRFRKPFNEAEK